MRVIIESAQCEESLLLRDTKVQSSLNRGLICVPVPKIDCLALRLGLLARFGSGCSGGEVRRACTV